MKKKIRLEIQPASLLLLFPAVYALLPAPKNTQLHHITKSIIYN